MNVDLTVRSEELEVQLEAFRGLPGPKGEKGDTGAIENLTINGKPVESGTITLTAADIGALGTSETAEDADKLGGKAPEYYIQPVNLLDNSDFTNPVNQRGNTSYTGAGYTIDRWKGESAACSMHIDANKSVAFNTSAEGTGVYWRQYLPQTFEQLTGKTFTLAVKDTGGNIYVASGTYPAVKPEATTTVVWCNIHANASIRLYARASDGAGIVHLNTSVNLPLEWAALYEGAYTADSLPLYAPDPYVVELAECQRYYRVYATQDARPSHGRDCSPPMRLDAPTQGTLSIGDATYYYNSADL